ncbi:MAG: hypothetical protein H6922_05050 [Pseudomonadaceae bacterium]|nr:hypothetical protein [Pseudomonadaceae bacterium]
MPANTSPLHRFIKRIRNWMDGVSSDTYIQCHPLSKELTANPSAITPAYRDLTAEIDALMKSGKTLSVPFYIKRDHIQFAKSPDELGFLESYVRREVVSLTDKQRNFMPQPTALTYQKLIQTQREVLAGTRQPALASDDSSLGVTIRLSHHVVSVLENPTLLADLEHAVQRHAAFLAHAPIHHDPQLQNNLYASLEETLRKRRQQLLEQSQEDHTKQAGGRENTSR